MQSSARRRGAQHALLPGGAWAGGRLLWWASHLVVWSSSAAAGGWSSSCMKSARWRVGMFARERAGGEITRLDERPNNARRHVSFMFRSSRCRGCASSEPQMASE